MRVLFLTNIPSPYRVDFFNEWGKFCDLTVTFEKRASDERDQSWQDYRFEHFHGIFLKGRPIHADTAFCPGIVKLVRQPSFDRIVCADFSSPTGMLAVQAMKNHRIPYWLESDGGFAKSQKGFKEKVKRHFIQGAQGYFSTAQTHDAYYMAYGASPDNIVRYPFTSLRREDILTAVPCPDEKRVLRNELGMTEEKIVLSVGQLIPRKGFDVLIHSMSKLPKTIGLYLVGGVPSKEYIALKEKLGLHNIHFVGYKAKNDLQKYYRAADLFVLPTREDIWGLVINEAMANGLGIITTDRCIAGLELVQNGKNGFIVKVGDSAALAARINQALANDTARRMGEKSLERIHGYTIEAMVQRHIEILQHG